jgi:hypothetical protein
MDLRPLSVDLCIAYEKKEINALMEPLDRVRQRRLMGPALTEIIAHAESYPDTDEALLVEQLRSVLAAVETPVDRLLARYPRLARRDRIVCDVTAARLGGSARRIATARPSRR